MNPDNLTQDRGDCNHDTRHVFNGTVIATSRFNGSRLWRFLLSDWKIAPLVRIMSGSSLNVQSGVDNSLTGVGLDRPNLIDTNSVYKHGYHSDPNHTYLNGLAFSQNALGTFGNLRRNAFKGPGYFDLDASASRIFELRESWNIEFRADAFNATNHVNFNNPATGLNSGTFGEITSAKANRVLQFSAKIHY